VLFLCLFVAVFAAAAAATWYRPALGVAALVAVDPFALYQDVGPTTVTLEKVVLAAVAAALIARRASFAALRDGRIRALLLGSLGVVAATALSIAQAHALAPAIRETLKAVEYLLIFSVTLAAFAGDPDEPLVWRAIIATTAAVAMIALAQELSGAPSVLPVGTVVVPRIAGPLEGPNQLAGYFGLALPLLTALILAGRAGRLAYAALTLGTAAQLLTLSRSGIITTMLALALVFGLAPAANRAAAALCLSAGTALAALLGTPWLGPMLSHLTSLEEVDQPGGVGRRSLLWHAAVFLWRQHPLFGIGAGNFELEVAQVGQPNVRTHANSLYLQSLVEGGIPLFTATAATVASSILSFARGPFSEPLVLGAFAAGIGLALHQFLDLLVFYPKVGGWWWIVLGLGAARLITARVAPQQ
jgi:O-antigen ligase